MRPLCYAVLGVCAARWLVPVLFPYLDPDPHLQRFLAISLGRFPTLAYLTIGVAYLVPYAILGVVIYFQFARAGGPVCTAPEVCARDVRRRAWLRRTVAVGLITALVGLAYANRFTADDAYISFRYARNLVEGAGLVYNPGERVEGYTNFLWVLLVAAGMRLGADPVRWAQFLGLVCFAGTLYATYRSARLLLPGVRWAWVAVFLVGTQFSVLSFATGGLETSLQTFLLALAWGLVFAKCGTGFPAGQRRGEWRMLDLLALSLVLAAGVLTRMDFAVFAGVLAASAGLSLWTTVRRNASSTALLGCLQPRRPNVGPAFQPVSDAVLGRKLLVLLLPAAVMVGVWLVWKGFYYGETLPNTYFAKNPGPGAAHFGLTYVWDFCKTYRYPLPGIVFLVGAVPLVRARHVLLGGVAGVILWAAYLVRMGGDFIEFRLLVPIVPLFVLGVLWTATRFSWSRRVYLPVFLAVWMAYGSLHHARTFGWVENRAEPVAHLKWQTENALWAEAGKELHRLFAGEQVIIATTVAGILPYYAGLTTLDMHGLTDATLARQGRIVSNRPGHKRFVGTDYLRQRGVNLVIGHPKIEPAAALDELPAEQLASCIQATDLPAEATLLAIPITARHVLLVWYLTPHPAIDRAIEREGWRTFVVSPVAKRDSPRARPRR
ncbi:MAG: hypothetical protein V2A79_06940 [Planctomycetota bacterium]